jgi:hypothetical protein
MKYSIKQSFEVSLEKLLQAREDRYKHLDQFPDLKDVILLEERKEGKNIFQKRKVDFGSKIPAVLATALNDPCLMEESVFDTESHTHEFKMFPPGKESVVTIFGKSLYKSTGENSSERSYDVDIRSGVLFVSPLIEAAVEEIHKHSLEKDRQSIRKFLGLS